MKVDAKKKRYTIHVAKKIGTCSENHMSEMKAMKTIAKSPTSLVIAPHTA